MGKKVTTTKKYDDKGNLVEKTVVEEYTSDNYYPIYYPIYKRYDYEWPYSPTITPTYPVITYSTGTTTNKIAFSNWKTTDNKTINPEEDDQNDEGTNLP